MLVKYSEKTTVSDSVIPSVIGFYTAADPLHARNQTGLFAEPEPVRKLGLGYSGKIRVGSAWSVKFELIRYFFECSVELEVMPALLMPQAGLMPLGGDFFIGSIAEKLGIEILCIEIPVVSGKAVGKACVFTEGLFG